jgi:hypothetical protein
MTKECAVLDLYLVEISRKLSRYSVIIADAAEHCTFFAQRHSILVVNPVVVCPGKAPDGDEPGCSSSRYTPAKCDEDVLRSRSGFDRGILL